MVMQFKHHRDYLQMLKIIIDKEEKVSARFFNKWLNPGSYLG
jgi:hypothetical protein